MTTEETPSVNLNSGLPPKKSSFASDVAKLASGTLFAQMLGFLVTPILARLFAPEAFGLAALFSSINAILIVIANMRYELAIMLPESDEEAVNLLGLSLLFTLLTTIVSVIFILFAGQFIPIWLNEPTLTPYLWFIPVSVLFGGSFTALNYWNSRTKKFGRLSIAQVIRSLGTSITQLGAGLLGFTTGGMMIGANVLGQVISSTVLGSQIWRDDHRLFRQSISWQAMIIQAKRYYRFPLFTTWSALLNSASWQLPAFLLTFYFSPTIVGYYALGQRVLRMPMSLLGRSIGQVFFQRASEAQNEGNLALVVENTFAWLVRLGLFPSLMLTFIGKDLFITLFGPEWAEAGVYVQILAPWTFFLFISSPMGTLFTVLERQEFSLYINMALFISRLFVLVLGGYSGNVRLTLILFSISGVLVYGSLNLIITTMVGIPLSRMLYTLFYNFTLCIPSIIILIGLHLWELPAWVVLSVTSILAGIQFSIDPTIRKVVAKKYFAYK